MAYHHPPKSKGIDPATARDLNFRKTNVTIFVKTATSDIRSENVPDDDKHCKNGCDDDCSNRELSRLLPVSPSFIFPSVGMRRIGFQCINKGD